jgi:small subunit ribosomal protein S16
MLAKDDEKRVVMNLDRIKALLATGAQPTDRVARFLESAGVLAKKVRSNPKAGTPGKAMAERAAKKAARSEAPAAE